MTDSTLVSQPADLSKGRDSRIVPVEVVEKPIQAEVVARAAAKKILGDRPLWATPLSIVRRGSSIGRLTDDITASGVVINWSGEYRFTPWSDFQGIESISQDYWTVMNLLNKFGQVAALDLIQLAIEEFQANEDYFIS
jgi:hypothetical protein